MTAVKGDAVEHIRTRIDDEYETGYACSCGARFTYTPSEAVGKLREKNARLRAALTEIAVESERTYQDRTTRIAREALEDPE